MAATAKGGRDVQIGKLYVATAARLDTLARDFAKAEKIASAAGKKASEEFQKAAKKQPANSDGGRALANAYLGRLENEFQRRATSARELLFRGLIDEEQAKAKGAEAAERFNAGLLHGLSKMRQAGKISEGVARELVAKLKDAGRRGAAAVQEGLSAGADRAGRNGTEIARRLASALENRFRTDLARIRRQLHDGLIDPKEAERRGRQAAERLNAGLRSGMNKLDARGKLTSGGLQILTDSFRNAQEEGAKVAGEAGQLPGVLGRIGMAAKLWIAGALVGAFALVSRGIRALFGTLVAAEERIRAFARLGAAGKLLGIDQDVINNTFRIARDQYKLTTAAAAELAVQVTKLAAKSGDAAKSQELLARALDLGSAQGMTAAEVGTALEQTLRGMDEGTDRLLQKNPSQVYEEYAQSIGKSAAALSDMEQKQALVWAVMEAGKKVHGEYSKLVDSDLGRLQAWKARWQENVAVLGTRFLPVVVQVAEKLEGPLAGALDFIGGLLDMMVSRLDRTINKMRELGVAAARLAPYEAERRIEEGREEERRLNEEVRELRDRLGLKYEEQERGPNARLGRLREAGPLTFDRVAAARARTQAALDRLEAAGTDGRDGAVLELQERLQMYDQLEARMEAYLATRERVRETEASLPELRATAALQRQLDGINRQIRGYDRLAQSAAHAAGVTRREWAELDPAAREAYLTAEQRAARAGLAAQAADLDVQINGPKPKEEGPPPEPITDAQKKKIEDARRSLRELVVELRVVSQYRNAAGEPFRNMEDVPPRLQAAVQGLLAIDAEIAKIRQTIAESREAPSEEIVAYLESLEALRARRKEAADEIAADPTKMLSAEAEQATEALDRVAAGFRTLRSLGVAAGEDVPQQLTAAVAELDRLDRELKEARENLAKLNEERVAIPEGTEEAIAELERQRAETVRLAGSYTELREIIALLPNGITDFLRSLDTEDTAAFTRSLTDLAAAAKVVQDAEAALTEARAIYGNRSREARDAERALVAARARAVTQYREIAAAVRGANLPIAVQRALLEAIEAALGEIEDGVGDAAKKWEEFGSAAGAVADITRQLGQLGRDLEILNDKQAAVIEGFAQMADGAAKFAAAASSGNVPGMISGAISFVQGGINFVRALTGESEGQRASRLAMLDLTHALKELEAAILNDRSTADLEADRDQIGRAADILERDRETYSSYGPTRRGALHDLAKALGIAAQGDSKAAAIDKLARWAAEMDARYGTNLADYVARGDTQGLMAALRALEDTLTGSIGELGTWANTYAGITERLNWELQVLGQTDAAERLRMLIQRLQEAGISAGDFADELAALAGLDLSTEAGRAEAEEILKAMMQAINAGGADFGNLSPDELMGLVLQWAEAIRGAAEGDAGGATSSYQVSREIREVTGTRIAGLLTTGVYWAEQTARGIAQLVSAITGGEMVLPPVPEVTDQVPPASTSSAAAATPPPAPAEVLTGGTIIVQFSAVPVDLNLIVRGGDPRDVEEAADGIGAAFGAGFGRGAFGALDEGFGKWTMERRRAAGRSPR